MEYLKDYVWETIISFSASVLVIFTVSYELCFWKVCKWLRSQEENDLYVTQA